MVKAEGVKEIRNAILYEYIQEKKEVETVVKSTNESFFLINFTNITVFLCYLFVISII